MSEVLNLNISILSYDDTDAGTTNNPLRRAADWVRRFSNVSVSKPRSQIVTLEPAESLSLFSGVRSTAIDGTTKFDLGLLSVSTCTYRLAWSAGTPPAFRTPRVLSGDATSEVTVSVNNNATATFTASDGTLLDFTGVQVGDIVRIGGVTTGDPAGPFSLNNEGYWVVLGIGASSLTCRRLPAAAFLASAETVVLGAGFASVLKVYSSTGVQIGDKLEVRAGFSVVTHRTYVVSQVTDSFVEFVSTVPLPLEDSVVVGVSGLVFYTSSKRVCYLESDQELVIRPNGLTSNELVISPFEVGDPDRVAVWQQIGNIYDLTIVNRSGTDRAEIFVFSCE